MSDWEVDTEGSTDINPPTAIYLIESTGGSDKKEGKDGHGEIRKTSEGCPMMMFKFSIVMNDEGGEGFRRHPFNIFITKDDKGSRQLRCMMRAFLPESQGKVPVTADMFKGKMAWVRLEHVKGFTNADHTTWEPQNARKIGATALSTDNNSPNSKAADDDLPF